VENELNPVLLNCSIGQFSASASEFENVTLPANITWYKNDNPLSDNDLSSREHLFYNGSLKIYPRNYRTSTSSDTYLCKAMFQNSVVLSKKVQVEAASKYLHKVLTVH